MIIRVNETFDKIRLRWIQHDMRQSLSGPSLFEPSTDIDVNMSWHALRYPVADRLGLVYRQIATEIHRKFKFDSGSPI